LREGDLRLKNKERQDRLVQNRHAAQGGHDADCLRLSGKDALDARPAPAANAFYAQARRAAQSYQNTRNQYNLPAFEKAIAYKANRKNLPDHFTDPGVQQSIFLDMELINRYDELLQKTELYILKHAKTNYSQELFLLQTIPGVGKILAMVILYELHDVNRFERVQNFCSYARLIKPLKESAGKTKGSGNKKMGNAYLKWAFSEAVILLLRESEAVKEQHQKLKNRHGKARALAILSHKLGRAVYYMLKNKKAFDVNQFVK